MGFLLLSFVVWLVVAVVAAAAAGGWFGTTCPISGQLALQKQEANWIFSLQLQDDLFCFYIFARSWLLENAHLISRGSRMPYRGDLRHLLALPPPTKATVRQIIE